MPIFRSDVDRTMMLGLIGEAAERYRCNVLAYCLMNNHVHLTVQDLDGDLSKALKHINGVYAQRFNARHDRTGHLFEGRFWNSLLETDSYLATATEYVHRNPVEAGIVERPEAYRWSSYRAYAGLSRGASFLEQGLVLGLYGNDRALLRAQTSMSRRDAAKENELRKPWPEPVLGSDSFRAHHMQDPATERTLAAPSEGAKCALGTITSSVATAFGVGRGSLLVARRGSKNEPRMVAIHIAASTTSFPHSQIAAYFALTAAHSVSNVSRRCGQAIDDDPALGARVERLRQALAVRGTERLAS